MTEQEFINEYRGSANELIEFMWNEGYTDFYDDIYDYEGVKDYLREWLSSLDWDYDIGSVLSNVSCVDNLDDTVFYTTSSYEFMSAIDDDDEDILNVALDALRYDDYFDEEDEEEEENYVDQSVESKPIPDSIMSVYLEKLNGSGNTEELLSILF